MSIKDKREIEKLIPRLRSSGYKLTSPSDPVYNCIAYAAGDDKTFWDPLGQAMRGRAVYWPAGFPADWALSTLCAIFESRGYEKCADGSLEPGFEKVVLYAENGVCKHAARQLTDGGWSSKLGKAETFATKKLAMSVVGSTARSRSIFAVGYWPPANHQKDLQSQTAVPTAIEPVKS